MKLLSRVVPFACLAIVAALWIGCTEEGSLSPSTESAFQIATPATPAPRTGFALGPVPGLTTGWHKMPDARVAIPRGTTVEVRYWHPVGATVLWEGATETRKERNVSYAECPVEAVGDISIRARAHMGNQDGTLLYDETCLLRIVDVDASELEVGVVTVSKQPFNLDETATNEQTMEQFFRGGSIATLTQVGPNHYRTATRTALQLSGAVTGRRPSQLAQLVEWRVNGVPMFLGSEVDDAVLKSVGAHTIEVGPRGRAQEIHIDTYGVRIVSHDNDTAIAEGQPVTFEAVTNPAGFEDEITWLSSTKSGTAYPVVGKGSTFTVVFDKTWADGLRWIGVKADGVVINKDDKAPDPEIESVVPTSGPPGTTFVCGTTPGFGTDPDDLCLQVVGGGRRAFTRATAADGTSITTTLLAVEPGMASGQVMASLGNGGRTNAGNPPVGMALPAQPWVWLANGGPSATSAATFTFTPPPKRKAVVDFWGFAQPDGTIELELTGPATCPAGTSFVMQSDALTLNETLRFDYRAEPVSTEAASLLACANRLCAIFQAAFFEHAGLLIFCTTQDLGGGTVKIILQSPVAEGFLEGGVYVSIDSP